MIPVEKSEGKSIAGNVPNQFPAATSVNIISRTNFIPNTDVARISVNTCRTMIMYATLMRRADRYTLMYMYNVVCSEIAAAVCGTWYESAMYRTLRK